MAENRSLRVELSANATSFIQGTRAAAESLKGIAREALGVRTAMAGITPEVEKLSRSIRGLSAPAGGLRDLTRDIDKLGGALRGLSGARDVALVANAIRTLSGSGTGLTAAVEDIRRFAAALGRITPASAAGMREIGTALHGIGSLSMGGASAEITAMSAGIRRLVRDANSVPALRALAAAIRDLGAAGGGLGNLGNVGNSLRGMQGQIDQLRRSIAGLRGAAGSSGSGGSSGGIFGQIFGGAALGNIAGNIGYAALSKITSGIKDTVKATADYETQLKTFGAVAHANNDQMKAAGDLAIKLGGDVTIAGASASDAASVLVELAKGGLNVASSFEAAKGTLQLASAATVDVGVAAGIQTAALNSFSLGAEQAGKVADILSNTAAAASGEITDFASGMKYSAVSSHELGLTLTENQTALALLAQSGMKGSMAGTNFNDVLMRLNPTTKKTRDAMKELGVTGFNANGQFEGMVPLIDQLTAAHKRLSPAEFEAANKAAFGAQGMRAAGIMATKGSAAYKDLYEKIDHGSGVVAFSTAKMSGLGGAFANVTNQVETAQVVIGEKWSATLQTMLGGIAAAIPKITSFLTGATLGNGLAGIGSWFKPLIDGAKALIETAWPYVQKFGQQLGVVWDGIVAGVKPVADAVGGLFKSIASDGTLSTLGGVVTGLGSTLTTVAGWLKPIGDAVAGVVGWFTKMPAPVKDAAIALGIMKLAAGPLVGIFKSVRQSIVMATYGMGALGFAGRSVGASMALVGNSIKTAFGGWIGLGITAAVTALTFFMSASHGAAQATTDFSDAIDTNTGKLNDNSAATIASKVKDAEAAYVAAGGAVGDYTSAVMGSVPAQQRVMASFTSLLSKQVGGTDEWHRYGAAYAKVGISQSDVTDAFIKGGGAVDVLKAKLSDNRTVLAGMGIDSTNAANGLDRIGAGAADTGKRLATYQSDVTGLADAQKTATVVANNAAAATKAAALAAEQMPAGTVFDDMQRHADAAAGAFGTTASAATLMGSAAVDGTGTAGDAYTAFASKVAGITVSVDDKGVTSFTTATEDAFAQYKQDTKDATDAADLFWFAAAGPAATAQQAVYAQAAAMRSIAADLRAQQANAADVVAKAATLKDVIGRKGKTELVDKKDASGKTVTNADGTAVQVRQAASDATTDADIAAARRDLAGATDTAATSEGELYNARVDASKLVFAQIATTYASVNASKGETAARAAAIAEMKKGRDAYVANYIAGEQASMSDADKAKSLAAVTVEAGKSADAMGLIPGKVTAYIDANATDLIAKTAEVKAKKDALTKATTVKFTADTKDALGMLADFGGNLKRIPPSLTTKLNADVATAEANGKRLYQVYDATTGDWKAQFLTPNEATARIKAGGVVQQYDRAKGTWTATLNAIDNGASAKAINLQKQAQLATQLRTLIMQGQDNASPKVAALLAQIALLKDKTVTLSVNAAGGVRTIAADGSFAAGNGVTGHANGGYISGPGGPREDKIPAMLSNGEFVVNAAATKKHGPLLHAINRKYADGGLVTHDNVGMTASGDISAATKHISGILATAQKSAEAANAAAAAAASAAALGSTAGAGGQDPSAFGWTVGKNIQPFSFQGIQFPNGVAGGTQSVWSSFLSELAPMIKGGIRPGEDWGYENRDNVNSPGQKSFHSYGLALDVNAPENGNGTSPGNGVGQVPPGAGALARKYNMQWGGEWSGTKDPMHFELHQAPGGSAGGGGSLGGIAGAVGSALTGAIANLTGGSGVERWRGLALQVAQAKGEANASVQVMLNQMSRESSGNPQAINLTDSNAQKGTPSKGLLQFIDGTFAANADPGFDKNIWDPASQMHAWYNYIDRTYGGYLAFSKRGYGAYANGGLVSGPGTGRSDSIPARVSNGEYIVNAKSTAQHLPLLSAINHYANGGLVGSLKGLSGGTVSTAGPELANVVQALQDIAQAVRDARDAVAGKKDAESTRYQTLVSVKSTAAANEAAAQGRLTAAKKGAAATAASQGSAAAAQLKAKADASAVSVAAARARLQAAQAAPHTGQWGKAITTAEAALKKAQSSSATAQASLDARISAVTKSKASSAAAKIESAQLQLDKVQSLSKVSVGNAQRAYDAAVKTTHAYAAAASAAEAYQRSQQRVYAAQQARAAQMDRLATSLTDAQAKLQQSRSDRASMASGISGTVGGFDGGITGHNDTRTTFATILKGQQYDVAQAQAFSVNIEKLRKLGLSNANLNTIAAAGVDGGGATAAGLSGATAAQIKQLNAVSGQVTRIGAHVGDVVAGQFYDAGIRAGAGLVNGINSQIGAIQRVMNHAAAVVVNTLTHKLQIHSPSRVMHGHGVNIVEGLNNGIMSGYGKVGSSMAGLVQIPNIPAQSYARAAAPAINLGGVKVYVGDREITDIVSVEIGGFTQDLGHTLEKAGMQA